MTRRLGLSLEDSLRICLEKWLEVSPEESLEVFLEGEDEAERE